MEAINFKRSGGEFNVQMRVLQSYTLHTDEVTGKIHVADDQKDGLLVGFNYATAEHAISWFKRFDQARCGMN